MIPATGSGGIHPGTAGSSQTGGSGIHPSGSGDIHPAGANAEDWVSTWGCLGISCGSWRQRHRGLGFRVTGFGVDCLGFTT